MAREEDLRFWLDYEAFRDDPGLRRRCPVITSIRRLAGYWTASEFNIVGDCCYSQAMFNSGSTIVVRTAVDYSTGTVPFCDGVGFTGETNNLSFTSAPTAQPGPWPAVVFTESNAGGATISSCNSAVTLEGTTRFYQQESPLVGTGYSGNVTATYEGQSVALSADGNSAIMGGYSDNIRVGAVRVFTRPPSITSKIRPFHPCSLFPLMSRTICRAS